MHDERGACWPGVLAADDRAGEPPISVGYAYGASGVALFLLYLHHATGDEALYALGRAALDFDLAQGVRLNDRARAYPSFATDAPEDNRVLRNYWEEGTAGVTTVALRYLASRPDPELRRTVAENLVDSSRKYANMPQLFHRLAGLGNVLLDAYEFSGEPQYRNEAWRTAEGILLFEVQAAEGTVFPGEQSLRASTDFATGSAGIGLFLQRLRTAARARTNFNFVLDELLPAELVALGDHRHASVADGDDAIPGAARRSWSPTGASAQPRLPPIRVGPMASELGSTASAVAMPLLALAISARPCSPARWRRSRSSR